MHKEKSPEEKYYLLPLHTELNVKCTELKVLYLIEKPYTCSCCISYTCGLDNYQFNLIGFLLSLWFTSAKQFNSFSFQKAAENTNFEELKTLTGKMSDLVNSHPHLKTMNLSCATNTNNDTKEDQTILTTKASDV